MQIRLSINFVVIAQAPNFERWFGRAQSFARSVPTPKSQDRFPPLVLKRRKGGILVSIRGSFQKLLLAALVVSQIYWHLQCFERG